MTFSNTEGAPVWLDLFTPDPTAAAAFYAAIGGWEVSEPNAEFGGYQIFTHGGGQIAGMMLNDGSMPPSWTVYLEAADAEAVAERITANGGAVVTPAMQVGDMGVMVFATDPAGAHFGVWQPLSHQGFHVRGEVGAPAWFEEHSRDFPASVAFYEKVFGWDTHVLADTDDFRYTTQGKDDAATAGIMDAAGFLPAQVPSHWTFYLEVENADATIAKAVELGGELVMGPDDSPFGRLAQLIDPQGAMFKIMQAPAG
jgi:uncharacterized protein